MNAARTRHRDLIPKVSQSERWETLRNEENQIRTPHFPSFPRAVLFKLTFLFPLRSNPLNFLLSQSPWKITGRMEMGSAGTSTQRATTPQTLEAHTNWGHILRLMRRPRWRWRKGKRVVGLSPSLGACRTLNFRGRRGSLATRCTLWKAKWRGLSETASDGWSGDANRWFMGGGDSFASLSP